MNIFIYTHMKLLNETTWTIFFYQKLQYFFIRDYNTDMGTKVTFQ